jgi:hypothetical protein
LWFVKQDHEYINRDEKNKDQHITNSFQSSAEIARTIVDSISSGIVYPVKNMWLANIEVLGYPSYEIIVHQSEFLLKHGEGYSEKRNL